MSRRQNSPARRASNADQDHTRISALRPNEIAPERSMNCRW